MVYSNINSAVFYKETPSVDPEDVGYSSTLFEMDVLGKTVLIVLGKAKHSFIERNVVCYPFYLVANGKVKSQIGIVEMHKNKAIEILDEDGDVDVSKLNPPLLYGFVNEMFIDRSGSDAELFMAEREKAAAAIGTKAVRSDQGLGKSAKENAEDKGSEKEGAEASDDEGDEVMKVKVHPGKASKEAEKAAKAQEKEAEKATKAQEKEAEKLKKEAEKEAEKLKKEQEKALKAAEKLAKETEKATKAAEKEAEKLAKEAAKATKEAEKVAKEAAKASKASKETEKKSAKSDGNDEPDVVKKFEFEGKKYLKSKKTGIIYNMEQDVIGKWNDVTNKIDFSSTDEEEEEEYEEEEEEEE